jgi:hypothetical protein
MRTDITEFPVNHPSNDVQKPLLQSTDVTRASLNPLDGILYASPRILTSTLLAGSYGAIVAYLEGASVALPFYTYGSSVMVASTTFFAGSYLSKYLRQKDDPINFAVSGGVNGLIFVTAMSGLRRGMLAGAAGSAVGAAYGLSSLWLFREFKSVWIQYRVQHLYYSKEKKLVVGRPKFPQEREQMMLLRRQQTREQDSATK